MDVSVSDGSAVSRGPDADVGMFSDAIGATPAFPSRPSRASSRVSPSRASPWIRRASVVSSFPTTDASTPSPVATSRDFNRPDATATTAFRFSSSGTGPCPGLRWPGRARRSTP